jgi:hypothetical protein
MMQKIFVLNNEAAIAEVNSTLADGNWRVTTIIPGGNGGAWLIVLSDIQTWNEIISQATANPS